MNYFCALLLIYSFSLCAQYNDSTYYYGGLTSTGSFNRTNRNTSYLFNNGVKFGIKKDAIVLNTNSKLLYGEQNEKLTNNDFSSVLDFNLYKTFPHFYYWGLLIYNSSYSLRVNNQFQGGLGIAYNVIDRKVLLINVSDGLIYDHSDINLIDGTREIYSTPRNSFRLHIKSTIKGRLEFTGNCFLQNSLENSYDYIIKSDVGLSIKLKKWLSFTSTFSYNEVSLTKSNNLLVTYGITIEKYFKNIFKIALLFFQD